MRSLKEICLITHVEGGVERFRRCKLKNVLFISNHDYRSARKANIHFLAAEARELFDTVNFLSIGYSYLTNKTKDVRCSLDASANRIEQHEGIGCYLWKTAIHPRHIPGPALSLISNALYNAYARWPSHTVDKLIRDADVVVLESGLAPIFIKRIVSSGADKRIVYIASDRLETISVHNNVIRDLNKGMAHIDFVRIAARDMMIDFSNWEQKVHFIPHGIDKAVFDADCPNPFTEPLNAVSIGSMLFDPSFFQTVAPKFPDMTFHVIGSKQRHEYPQNVVQYPEMPFEQTVGYIKHATVGLAPYRHIDGGDYLADSSMKLRQYGYAGLPSVCAQFAAAAMPRRYGYDPRNPEEMLRAMEEGIKAAETKEQVDCLSWKQVAEQIFC